MFRHLEERGYHLLRDLQPKDLPCFTARLGTILHDPRDPTPIRDIRPQTRTTAPSNSLSSRFGLGSFPFHTDVAHWTTPARYLMLYCLHPGRGERPTLLQDSRSWSEAADIMRVASCEVWKSGHVRPQLCTVSTVRNGHFAIRFDEACMTPMTSAAIHLRDQIRRNIQLSPITTVDWSAGMLLVLDNYRMLHARGMASRPDLDRVIRRVLVGRKNERMEF
jgi:alpha-ketoglutarate-dependent taurine dioxygenase